jgi:hypothetical protein
MAKCDDLAISDLSQFNQRLISAGLSKKKKVRAESGKSLRIDLMV